MAKFLENSSSRVLVNTAAQYSRSIISLLIALYATRLILNALGVNDYGIFSLVAGIVAMLSFISNALISTTQRFLSYNQGTRDLFTLKKLWGNIIILHIGVSILLVVILEIIGPLLFDGFLVIAPERLNSAKIVYQGCIFMVILSFLSAPFQALLISHENIVYISLIQIIDSVFRLIVAILITKYGEDKLVIYVSFLCVISIFDILSYAIYTFRKYPECVIPQKTHLDKHIIFNITSFLTWSIYSTGCVVGRTQGCAIVLNRFFGTVVNSAFGIAQQVSGAISFVSSSLLNAINPLIVKAEGGGERNRMFKLSMTASKFSFFLLSIFVLPLVSFMPHIIKMWLGEIPEYVTLFCRVILITALCDQITSGLITANLAIGNVKSYSLTINSIKFLTVPFLVLLLWSGVSVEYSIWIYALMELICAFCRLPFLHYYGGLNVMEFYCVVFKPFFIPLPLLCCIYYYLSTLPFNLLFNLLATSTISILYIVLFYKAALSPQEKVIVDKILKKVRLVK